MVSWILYRLMQQTAYCAHGCPHPCKTEGDYSAHGCPEPGVAETAYSLVDILKLMQQTACSAHGCPDPCKTEGDYSACECPSPGVAERAYIARRCPEMCIIERYYSVANALNFAKQKEITVSWMS